MPFPRSALVQSDKIVNVDNKRDAAVAHDGTARKSLALYVVLGKVGREGLYYNLLLSHKLVGEEADASVIRLSISRRIPSSSSVISVLRPNFSCRRRIG